MEGRMEGIGERPLAAWLGLLISTPATDLAMYLVMRYFRYVLYKCMLV